MKALNIQRDDITLQPCTVTVSSFKEGVRLTGELQSITEFGAKLRVPSEQEIPERLSVLIPKLHVNVGCRVIWRHRNDVALLFDRKVEVPDAQN